EFECGAVPHSGVTEPAASASDNIWRIVLHREGNAIREPVRTCSSRGRVDEAGGETVTHRVPRIGEGTAGLIARVCRQSEDAVCGIERCPAVEGDIRESSKGGR